MACVYMYNGEYAPMSPHYLQTCKEKSETHIKRKVHNRRAKKLKARGEEIFEDFINGHFIWFMRVKQNGVQTQKI